MEEKQQYCCRKMASTLEEHMKPLKYDFQSRTYMMEYHSYQKPRKNHVIVCETLNYCPFCGAKFPEQLNSELSRILREEYHLQDAWEQLSAGNVPDEFKTDEWWKKRGL